MEVFQPQCLKQQLLQLKELNFFFKHKMLIQKFNLVKLPDIQVLEIVLSELWKKKVSMHFIEETLPMSLDISQLKLLILLLKTHLEFIFVHLTQKLKKLNIFLVL